MRNNKGQLLIESIIAISLIVIGLLGIFSLLSQSLGLRRVVSERYIATYLAAEGIEVVKNMIDTNYVATNGAGPWNTGLNTPGDYEVQYNSDSLLPDQDRNFNYDPTNGIYSYEPGGNPTAFKRKITISYPGCPAPNCENHMQVNSLVTWVTRGGGVFDVNLEDHFYDWFSS